MSRSGVYALAFALQQAAEDGAALTTGRQRCCSLASDTSVHEVMDAHTTNAIWCYGTVRCVHDGTPSRNYVRRISTNMLSAIIPVLLFGVPGVIELVGHLSN